MEQENEDILLSGQVSEFITLVSEYCHTIENIVETGRKEFLWKMQKILPLLYMKTSMLPEIESASGELVEKFVTEEEWSHVDEAVSEKFDHFNPYPAINTESENYSVTHGSLSENFADIYQDLKDFISLYNMGTPEMMQDALHECITSFKEYWGHKLLENMKPIHHLLYNENIEDEFDQPGKKIGFEDITTDSWIISRQKDHWNDHSE